MSVQPAASAVFSGLLQNASPHQEDVEYEPLTGCLYVRLSDHTGFMDCTRGSWVEQLYPGQPRQHVRYVAVTHAVKCYFSDAPLSVLWQREAARLSEKGGIPLGEAKRIVDRSVVRARERGNALHFYFAYIIEGGVRTPPQLTHDTLPYVESLCGAIGTWATQYGLVPFLSEFDLRTNMARAECGVLGYGRPDALFAYDNQEDPSKPLRVVLVELKYIRFEDAERAPKRYNPPQSLCGRNPDKPVPPDAPRSDSMLQRASLQLALYRTMIEEAEGPWVFRGKCYPSAVVTHSVVVQLTPHEGQDGVPSLRILRVPDMSRAADWLWHQVGHLQGRHR